MSRRVALAVAVGWLPLVLITVLFNIGGLFSLLCDYRVYARILIAVPRGAKQIVVTGPHKAKVTNLNDLSGEEVFVKPLAVYSKSLRSLNKSLGDKWKKPVFVRSADTNLGDEDLLEMVNAGLIPATVTIDVRAQFWARVFDHLRLCAECVLSNEEQLAWLMRKDSPKLKRLVDEFVEGHREGTSFGNTLFRRYLQNTKWVKMLQPTVR